MFGPSDALIVLRIKNSVSIRALRDAEVVPKAGAQVKVTPNARRYCHVFVVATKARNEATRNRFKEGETVRIGRNLPQDGRIRSQATGAAQWDTRRACPTNTDAIKITNEHRDTTGRV